MSRTLSGGVVLMGLAAATALWGADPAPPQWSYSPALLRPFWEGDEVEGESVLFIKDEKTGEARASLLFPVTEIVAVRSSAGDVTYENGKDYVWKPNSREIVLPAGSKIPSHTTQQLRRPAKSQKYELTHRDGNGEIYFGGELEYAAMQTCFTYKHAPDLWKGPVPKFSHRSLPRSVAKLVSREPLTIVTLGDSISAGANASGLFNKAPYQPPYPELVRRQLSERFRNANTMHNLSLGGSDTGWSLTQIDKVVEQKPDLVILAFGMNDSAGRAGKEYGANIKKAIAGIREKLPQCEFILVASMLGNRDWIRLKQEYFLEYRTALKELVEPGIALADLTSVWESFLELKKDWDQTGNGVNHPNDFGHRVYAQVITSLLDPRGVPDTEVSEAKPVTAGPLRFAEQRLLAAYTYSYACATADLDGDGNLDLTTSDAESNSNLYLLRGDGKGGFKQSFIQKYAGLDEQPIRLERHAIGDVNGDGLLDVVIVDNLKGDVRWYTNPGKDAIAKPWKVNRVSEPRDIPGAYEVSLADFDGDGDLDVAASSWVGGKRFDWFENVGSPGKGEKWVRHVIEDMVGETRTIVVGDFNRDGKPDLLGTVRTAHQLVWYANPGKPATETWKKSVIDDKTLAPTHAHAVDLDGDGDLDVLAAFGLVAPATGSAQSHQVAWYENVGKPGLATEWKKHVIGDNFPQGFEAVAGDLDGDGDQDVVATGWAGTGNITWFENTGDPKTGWKRHLIKDKWPNAVTVIVADFDKDGRLDIAACAERGANEIRWWRNMGPAH
ncbi:MAG: VCBS repeat-containing protein [Planctomycetaceae bacterium]|nr:VCBS repeat-containing protein [Planctomycetaceae bacterium]